MATNIVVNSSGTRVQAALKQLSKQQFPKKRIIGPKNKFLEDTIRKTNAATFTTGSIDTSHMSQYLASSVICHCFDGWNFLSKGVECLLSGDISSSIHLTYYSELRAVMCILACEGIGIFDRKHVYFDSTGSEHIFQRNTANQNLTTHKAADELITEWASINSKKDSVFRFIKVNNRPIRDWLNASPHSTSMAYAGTVASQWLKSWSFDLRLQNDQKLRNETSYRPHFAIKQVDINNAIDMIMQIWEGLEPMPSNRFAELDMHLLRVALEQLFKMSTGKTRSNASYKTFINNIFDNLGESKTQNLYEFILRRISPDDHVLLEQAAIDSSDNTINFNNPLPMICRAILLLRFATGYTNLTFEDSAVSLNSLDFWWEEIAYKFGITATNPSGIIPIDLYSDIEDSITNLRPYHPTLTNLNSTNSFGLTDLCNLKQFQRAFFWGIGI